MVNKVKPKKKSEAQKRSLANLKPIQKGQVLNPLGGKAHNPAMKKLKRLTEEELIEVGSLVVKGNVKELENLKNDKDCSVLKAMMSAVAVKAINKGDSQALDILLNRIVGKVKERVEQSITVEPKVTYKTKWGGTTEPTDGIIGPGENEDD